MLLLIYHLAGLNSFGVPYMAPVVTCGYAEDGMEDFVIRKPIKKLSFDRHGRTIENAGGFAKSNDEWV